MEPVDRLRQAARRAQGALAMLTSPDAIRQTTVRHAWAQAVAAEAELRAALAMAPTAAKVQPPDQAAAQCGHEKDHPMNEQVEKALEAARTWHEEQDKAISKQPKANEGQNGWMRLQHREQIDAITEALSALQSSPVGGELERENARLRLVISDLKHGPFDSIATWQARATAAEAALREREAETGELLAAVAEFMPSAQVAFLWPDSTPPEGEMDRARKRYARVLDALAALQPEAPTTGAGEE